MAPKSVPHLVGLSPAQLVWRHATEAPDDLDQHDVLAVVLDLLRIARHDVSTMLHALTLGRTRLRESPADLVAGRATLLLEQAITFMGIEPRAGDR